MDEKWKKSLKDWTGRAQKAQQAVDEITGAKSEEKNDAAVLDVINNANQHRDKKPNIRTLTEEFCEAFLSFRGKHDDPLRLELVQIAGVCINMIRQIDSGEDFKP